MNPLQPILPSCSFGNLFYFRLMLEPGAVIDTGEHYIKQTWRNRYDIVAANGLLALTIPVIGQRGEKTPLHSIEVDFTNNWPSLHWKTLVSAYASSAFFEHYADELEDFIMHPPNTLAAFNLASIKLIYRWLELDFNINISKQYHHVASDETDLRPHFKPAKFHFPDFRPPSYFQVFSHKQKFHSNPSVLDAIFNLGPETADYLRQIPFEASQIVNLADQFKQRYGRN